VAVQTISHSHASNLVDFAKLHAENTGLYQLNTSLGTIKLLGKIGLAYCFPVLSGLLALAQMSHSFGRLQHKMAMIEMLNNKRIEAVKELDGHPDLIAKIDQVVQKQLDLIECAKVRNISTFLADGILAATSFGSVNFSVPIDELFLARPVVPATFVLGSSAYALAEGSLISAGSVALRALELQFAAVEAEKALAKLDPPVAETAQGA